MGRGSERGAAQKQQEDSRRIKGQQSSALVGGRWWVGAGREGVCRLLALGAGCKAGVGDADNVLP